MSERWWVVAPFGHRQHEAQNVQSEMMFMGEMVNVINVPPPPLDEWSCDWCNSMVRLEWTDREGRTRPCLVPMLGSSALCLDCMAKALHMDPKDMRITRASTWSMQVCACPPCTTALPLMVEILGMADGV